MTLDMHHQFYVHLDGAVVEGPFVSLDYALGFSHGMLLVRGDETDVVTISKVKIGTTKPLLQAWEITIEEKVGRATEIIATGAGQ